MLSFRVQYTKTQDKDLPRGAIHTKHYFSVHNSQSCNSLFSNVSVFSHSMYELMTYTVRHCEEKKKCFLFLVLVMSI